MNTTPQSELSERELEILRLVATGASNKEIATQLFISANTVKVHLRNIFSKIDAASRTEAAMYAVRIGLVKGISERLVSEESVSDLPADQEPIPEIITQQPKSRYFRFLWVGFLIFFLILTLIYLGLTRDSGLLARFSKETISPTLTQIPRWRELAALPSPKSSLAMVAYENQLFVIGGESSEGITGELLCYDIQTDSWTNRTAKPIPIADADAVVINGLIYVPGGRTGADPSQLTDQLEIYDPYLDQWSLGEPLPHSISGYAALAYEGRLYIFGGWDGQNYLANVYMYDPIQDSWQERWSMPTARAFSGAAVAGDMIYVIGGFDGNQALAINEMYSPNRENNRGDPWGSAQPLPQGRYGMGIAGFSDLIYLIGGVGSEGEILEPLEYSPSLQTWQTFTMPLPEDWSRMGTVSLGPYIYTLGGTVQGLYTDLFLSYKAFYTVVLPFIP